MTNIHKNIFLKRDNSVQLRYNYDALRQTEIRDYYTIIIVSVSAKTSS